MDEAQAVVLGQEAWGGNPVLAPRAVMVMEVTQIVPRAGHPVATPAQSTNPAFPWHPAP